MKLSANATPGAMLSGAGDRSIDKGGAPFALPFRRVPSLENRTLPMKRVANEQAEQRPRGVLRFIKSANCRVLGVNNCSMIMATWVMIT